MTRHDSTFTYEMALSLNTRTLDYLLKADNLLEPESPTKQTNTITVVPTMKPYQALYIVPEISKA